ncbi:uncharacterized protein LOC143425685 [Xylocopa sonorina]|uniref:uncharacterized protein LOC143425685 n=1 Tax=Xylocopa sonorina TaxID=1818115 RepID=UPI00403AC465
MELFRSFLRVLGLLQPTKVSRKWAQLCKSDRCLRRTAKRYIREKKRKIRAEFMGLSPVNERRGGVARVRTSQHISYSAVRINAPIILRRHGEFQIPSKQRVRVMNMFAMTDIIKVLDKDFQ